MKIKAPIWAIETGDEGIILLTSWLYRLAQQEGFDIVYYLNASDVRYIIQRYTTTPHIQFKSIMNWMKIGADYNSSWSFRFIEKPETMNYEFKNQRWMFIYGFLIGREASMTGMVQDGAPLMDKKHQDIVMPEYMRDLFSYYGMIKNRGGSRKGRTVNRSSTLGPDIEADIIAAYQSGRRNITQLAKDFGVTYSKVYYAINVSMKKTNTEN